MSNTGNVQAARIRGQAMGGARSARTAVRKANPEGGAKSRESLERERRREIAEKNDKIYELRDVRRGLNDTRIRLNREILALNDKFARGKVMTERDSRKADRLVKQRDEVDWKIRDIDYQLERLQGEI